MRRHESKKTAQPVSLLEGISNQSACPSHPWRGPCQHQGRVRTAFAAWPRVQGCITEPCVLGGGRDVLRRLGGVRLSSLPRLVSRRLPGQARQVRGLMSIIRQIVVAALMSCAVGYAQTLWQGTTYGMT